MPEQGGPGVQEQLARMGKDILWLRIALILALVVLALVAVAVLQMRAPVTEMAAAEAAPARRTVQAARFVLLDAKGKRGEFSVRDGAACLELFDADGKCVWTTPAAPAPEPGTGTKAPEPEKEK